MRQVGMRQRALLLVNRQSRRGQQNIKLAIQQLTQFGFDLIEATTEHPEQLSSVIRDYSDRVDLVIIGGGDGTLNAAIPGLLDTQLPLGILPLGTANDLARTLKIPANIPEACQIIARRNVDRIDLGQVNDRYFFNVASFGLSVDITERLTQQAKRRWGVLAYGFAALQALWQSRPFTAEIHTGTDLNTVITTVKTIQVAVGNGLYYGGGLAVAQDATIHDERLDLYSLEISRWWQLVKLLPALYKGRHHLFQFVHAQQGSEFTIITHRPYPINTDGEITTTTPAHFKVLPKALPVLLPNPTQSLGFKL
jgi:diacylglycerol kinase (ATP)